eukprot:s3066_g3.t1
MAQVDDTSGLLCGSDIIGLVAEPAAESGDSTPADLAGIVGMAQVDDTSGLLCGSDIIGLVAEPAAESGDSTRRAGVYVAVAGKAATCQKTTNTSKQLVNPG